ncbi:hydroxyacylglutathione hydrolase [soil metagenome]
MIFAIPCLSDNYAYLVRCPETGRAAIVDPSEAAPVLAATKDSPPSEIWCTHHHFDHVGGNDDLVSALAIERVVGHVSDKGRIPQQNVFLADGDSFTLGSLRVRVLHVPGHTAGAIAYVVEGDGAPAVFTGDTLFLAGCGRLFEGTPADMFASLAKLRGLPPQTRVYCGHEYTQSNLKFAAHVEPDNASIREAAEAVAALRAANRPTVPGDLATELETNPFLRAKTIAELAERRAQKDVF